MKKALLSVSTEKSINIGDYIQALASSQFLDNTDLFIERETLRDYNGEDVAMIMNGWYMHHPEQWPPSPKIHPLFVAFHMNNLVDNKLLGKESISYLKQYEPIGCRDLLTVKKLERHGVKAYFSGCMTLTLGYKYHSENKDGKVYIVDPVVTFNSKIDKLKYLLLSVFRFKTINTIYQKQYSNNCTFRILHWCKSSKFFYKYNKLFDKKLLIDAEYVQHEGAFYHKYKTPEALLKKAEDLVKAYAKASCVITSRIHCALPCLGLDTPVIYVNNDLQKDVSSCRLDGLSQLFNIVHWTGTSLKIESNQTICRIDKNNFPLNNTEWKKYAEELINNCNLFFESYK